MKINLIKIGNAILIAVTAACLLGFLIVLIMSCFGIIVSLIRGDSTMALIFGASVIMLSFALYKLVIKKG